MSREAPLDRITDESRRELLFQKSALDHACIVSETDARGRITYVNEQFCQISGYSREELVGQDHRLLNSGQHPRSFWTNMFSELDENGVWQGTVCNKAKDGSHYWVRTTNVAFRNNKNRIERYVSIRTDITEQVRAQSEIDQFFTASQDLHCIIKPDGYFKRVSPAWQSTLGYEEEQLLSKPFLDLIHPSDLNYVKDLLSDKYNAMPSVNFECRLRCSDGNYLWMHWIVVNDNINNLFYASARDITDRKKMTSRLTAQAAAIDASQAVVEFDIDGNILIANQRFLDLMGFKLEDIVGRHHRIFVDHEYAESKKYRQFWSALRKGQFQTAEFKRLSQTGKTIWLLATYTPVLGADGRPERIIKFATDVTTEKMAEHELEVAAHTDMLTGLPNRSQISEQVRKAIKTNAGKSGSNFSLLFLDFDRFKLVNDTLGHAMGDVMLTKISDRLLACIKQNAGAGVIGTAARLGGDEFVVLLENLTQCQDAYAFAHNLLAVFNEPFVLNGQKVYSTASIGIADSDLEHATPEELFRDADTAMYEAKSSGKNRYVVFTPDMREKLQARVNMERDLHHAVENNEFRVLYQPINCVESGEIVGAEALVRWDHPTKGLICPADFIPLAEDCGLIIAIGEWVLREACTQFMHWQQQPGGKAIKTISINLSRNQLVLTDLPQRIDKVFKQVGIRPEQVKLEITESTVMRDVESAKSILSNLKKLGVQVVMDDFGTGYSSLSCLHQFHFDGIKIDRSFIKDVDTNRSVAALVQTISSLASNLGVSVVAEGVETMSQFTTLQALDCHFAQGYLFGRPMPAEDLIGLIQAPPRKRKPGAA